MTNGRLTAVVVPALGRLMAFGAIGDENVLWDAPLRCGDAGGSRCAPYRFGPRYVNWGGDKIWLAPQGRWQQFYGKGWPPDPDWDGTPHEAQPTAWGIRLTSRISSKTGLQIVREFAFSGDALRVTSTMTKRQGAPIRCSVWEIAQEATPDTVFVPASAAAVKWLQGDAASANVSASNQGGVCRLDVRRSKQFKAGILARPPEISATSGDWRLSLATEAASGEFPDAVGGAGFPVEYYNEASAGGRYGELELLAPLKTMRVGDTQTLVAWWRLSRRKEYKK